MHNLIIINTCAYSKSFSLILYLCVQKPAENREQEE